MMDPFNPRPTDTPGYEQNQWGHDTPSSGKELLWLLGAFAAFIGVMVFLAAI